MAYNSYPSFSLLYTLAFGPVFLSFSRYTCTSKQKASSQMLGTYLFVSVLKKKQTNKKQQQQQHQKTDINQTPLTY